MANTNTRTPDGADVWGRNYIQVRDYTFDGTVAYVSGTGITINAQDVGLKGIRGVVVAGGSTASNNYIVVFNLGPVAGGTFGGILPSVNVRLYSALGTELASGTYTSFELRLLFFGI